MSNKQHFCFLIWKLKLEKKKEIKSNEKLHM